MSQSVARDLVVHIYYVLKDENGEVLDASGDRPLGYLHGHGNVLAGLEQQLEGKEVGDEVEVTLTPEQGYGVYDPAAFESVHRRDLPKGTRVEVGAPVRAEGSDGKVVVLWITQVKGARVTITTNHPLAGKTLNFNVRVAAIRGASAEEIEHEHVHEPGMSH